MAGKWFLIENNWEHVFSFKSLEELKRFARKRRLKLKKSLTFERCFIVTH
jgi:hypothetical protein